MSISGANSVAKKRLQLRFGKTTKYVSVSPPQSGIAHNG
jgi:hypothetical protein